MPKCTNCERLDGALSRDAEPHSDLEQVKATKYRAGGLALGQAVRYRCKACGTRWSRDMDRKDELARWETTTG
jgi:hypothetical protein